MRVHHAGGPLAHKYAPALLRDEGDEPPRRCTRASWKGGQLTHAPVPAGDTGFWQGAIRDPEDPSHGPLLAAAQNGLRIALDLLYGDHEGGQRTVARFIMAPNEESGGRSARVLRYWNIDREDPR